MDAFAPFALMSSHHSASTRRAFLYCHGRAAAATGTGLLLMGILPHPSAVLPFVPPFRPPPEASSPPAWGPQATWRGECTQQGKERRRLVLSTRAMEGRRRSKRKPLPIADPLIAGTSVHARHLLSGAVASVTARSLLAPLERVKIELQLNQREGGAGRVVRSILRKEGVTGLWKGNALNCIRTAPYRALNYYVFDRVKAQIVRRRARRRRSASGMEGDGAPRSGELTRVERMGAGAAAGVTAILCCFPLDVLRTRMLSATPMGASLYAKGPIRTLAGIVRGEGLASLYVGVLPALASLAPSNAVFYAVFDTLKARHLRWARDRGQAAELGAGRTLLYGGAAGVAAECSVYPLEVVRRRLQLARLAALGGREGGLAVLASGGGGAPIPTMLAHILRTEGLRGLYWGILPTALQVMPSAAISYYVFEVCKRKLKVEAGEVDGV